MAYFFCFCKGVFFVFCMGRIILIKTIFFNSLPAYYYCLLDFILMKNAPPRREVRFVFVYDLRIDSLLNG